MCRSLSPYHILFVYYQILVYKINLLPGPQPNVESHIHASSHTTSVTHHHSSDSLWVAASARVSHRARIILPAMAEHPRFTPASVAVLSRFILLHGSPPRHPQASPAPSFSRPDRQASAILTFLNSRVMFERSDRTKRPENLEARKPF
jgi:hypothetical protein